MRPHIAVCGKLSHVLVIGLECGHPILSELTPVQMSGEKLEGTSETYGSVLGQYETFAGGRPERYCDGYCDGYCDEEVTIMTGNCIVLWNCFCDVWSQFLVLNSRLI